MHKLEQKKHKMLLGNECINEFYSPNIRFDERGANYSEVCSYNSDNFELAYFDFSTTLVQSVLSVSA